MAARVATGTMSPAFPEDAERRRREMYKKHDESLEVTGSEATTKARADQGRAGGGVMHLGTPVARPGAVVTSTQGGGFSPRSASSRQAGRKNKALVLPPRHNVSAGTMTPAVAAGSGIKGARQVRSSAGFLSTSPSPPGTEGLFVPARPRSQRSQLEGSVAFQLPPTVPSNDRHSTRSNGTRPAVLVDGTAEDFSAAVAACDVPTQVRKARKVDMKALERLAGSKPLGELKVGPQKSYDEVMSLFKSAGGVPSMKPMTPQALLNNEPHPVIDPERFLSSLEQKSSAARLAKLPKPHDGTIDPNNAQFARSAGVIFGEIVVPRNNGEAAIMKKIGAIRNDPNAKHNLKETIAKQSQRAASPEVARAMQNDIVQANATRETVKLPWDASMWTGGAKPSDKREWERICRTKEERRKSARMRAEQVMEEKLQRKYASATRHEEMRKQRERDAAKAEATAHAIRVRRLLCTFIVFTKWQYPVRALAAKRKEEDANIEERIDATTTIQTRFRGWKSRSFFNKMKAATTLIQTFFKDNVMGKSDDRRKAYANAIADMLLLFEQHNDLKVKLSLLMVKVTTIQRHIRTYLLRRRAEVEIIIQQWTNLERTMIEKKDFNRMMERKNMGASAGTDPQQKKLAPTKSLNKQKSMKDKQLINEIFEMSPRSPREAPKIAAQEGPTQSYELIIKDNADMADEERYVPATLKRLIIESIVKLRMYVFMYMLEAWKRALKEYDDDWHKENEFHEAKVTVGAVEGPLPYNPPPRPQWRTLLPQTELRAAMAEGVAYNTAWRKMEAHANIGTKEMPPRNQLIKERLGGIIVRNKAMEVRTCVSLCPKEYIPMWYPPSIAATGIKIPILPAKKDKD